MTIEGPLDTWYVGEHKILRWTVRDRLRQAVNVTGWTVTVTIYRRRQAVPVTVLNAEVVSAVGGVVAVNVPAVTTTTLGAGSYRLVVARTNPGSEQVVASEDFNLNARGV